VVAAEFPSLETIVVAGVSFVGLGLALLTLNDRIEDHLPDIVLESRVTEILDKGDVDRDGKTKLIVTIAEANRTEEGIKGEVVISNILAVLALVVGLLPLFFHYLNLETMSMDFATLVYEICSISIAISTVFNRVANSRYKDLKKKGFSK
jgi:hypothetical protein